MQLRGAVSSHVGNVRENNQDRAHFGGFVAAVADGMGGHQGGEMAASIAIKEFLSIVEPIAPGGLVELVEDANRAVFERAADPDLRGMGTTLVALTLRPAEGKISVVNVGDSRAYFFRDGELSQLTLDHSLVEDLVRQKRLTKEEALHHPQRNILTRALGIASHVDVDRFLFEAHVGDRYLLCSDGLFNEVDERDIARILGSCPSPDAAADQLVAAALAAAGRDNVTVTIVDVVEDGEGGSVSSRPAETLMVPAVQNQTLAEPDPGANAVGEVARTTQPAAGVGVDVAEPGRGPGYEADYDQAGRPEMAALELDQLGDQTYDAALYEAGSYDTAELPQVELPEPKRGKLGPMIAGLLFLALVAGIVYLGVGVYANRAFFVGVNPATEEVVIFQGRPGGLLWAQPTATDPTNLSAADLTDEGRALVEQEQTFGSRGEAAAFVEEIRISNVEEVVDATTVESLVDGAESEAPAGTTTDNGTEPTEDEPTEDEPTDTTGPAGATTDESEGASARDASSVGANAVSIAQVASNIDIGS